MTTISSRSTHSNPLARTKGGCANDPSTTTLSRHTSENRTRSKRRRLRDHDCHDDEDDGGNGGSDSDLVLLEDDEEIESVEADGTAQCGSGGLMSDEDGGDDGGKLGRGGVGDDNDGGPGEKQLLTAALVTSIVEASSSTPAEADESTQNSTCGMSLRKQGQAEENGVVAVEGAHAVEREEHDNDATTTETGGDVELDLEDAIQSGITSYEDNMKDKDSDSVLCTNSPSEALMESNVTPAHVTPPTADASSFSPAGSPKPKPNTNASTAPASLPLFNNNTASDIASNTQINDLPPRPSTQVAASPATTNNDPLEQPQKQTPSRTIYPRASKAVACTKVADLVSPSTRKTSTAKPKSPSPESKKRKITIVNGADAAVNNLNATNSTLAGVPSSQPLAPSNTNGGSSTLPIPATLPSNKAAVGGAYSSTTPAYAINNTAHPPPPQYSFPTIAAGMNQPNKPVTRPKTKVSRGVMAPIPSNVASTPAAYSQGLKMNPSPVPNPLASFEDTPSKEASSPLPPPSSSSAVATASTQLQQQQQQPSKNASISSGTAAARRLSKTTSLMSAAPHALLPPSNPASRRQSEDPLGVKYSNIAESMSSQQWQTDGLASSAPSEIPPQVRGRIFSIDLDPAVLDFVESVVDPLATDDAAPDAPPSSSDAADNKNVTFKIEDDDKGTLSRSGSFLRRDRGFSFEFFSFGNDDEPLPPTPLLMCDSNDGKQINSISIGNRLRGDSIIFDPISFCDGGVHDTSALLHIKQEDDYGFIDQLTNSNNQASSSEPHVFQPMNAPSSTASQAAAPAPTTLLQTVPQSSVPQNPQKASAPVSVTFVNKTTVSSTHHARPTQSKPRAKAKHTQPLHVAHHGPAHFPQITVAAGSSYIPHGFANNNTIHMPHGSDAAAAAAAGMPQHHNPSSPTASNNDGFTISHTACPMELLNKGGRIGIYLPEERKARIAKFHSKRKIRIWRKRIKYDCRKKLADSRPRIKGRFVKRSDVDGEDELL